LTGFPSLKATQKQRLEEHRIDPEVSLRGLVGELTGRTGADLEQLIVDGANFGREHEADDAPTMAEIELAGGQSRPRDMSPEGELRPSEVRVLNLIADGKTVAQVAEELDLSSHTVQTQAKTARARLGASTMPQAIRLAIRSGQIAA
jgi:DNA-binding CsgD family transcriptional regulator